MSTREPDAPTVDELLDIVLAGVECNPECPWCPAAAAGTDWTLHDPDCCARRVLEHRTAELELLRHLRDAVEDWARDADLLDPNRPAQSCVTGTERRMLLALDVVRGERSLREEEEEEEERALAETRRGGTPRRIGDLGG